MSGFLAVLIAGALANNAVLTHLLGIDPALHGSGRLRNALTVALATGAVLIAAVNVCWLIEHFVLVPFDIDWLRALVFVLVIAALAPWSVVIMRRCAVGDVASVQRTLSPLLLIGNGLLLGVIAGAIATHGHDDFGTMLARVFGAAIGFGMVLALFTAIRDRLDGADVPMAFRGAPILLITAAIVAMAFMGFAGIAR